MRKRGEQPEPPLKVLAADDSPDAIAQVRLWIQERWPGAQVLGALAPEEAISTAIEQKVENLVLDVDFGAHRNSGVVVARKILEARSKDRGLPTRVLFRTVHAADPGYLRQIDRLIADEKRRPVAWGFLDKGSVPKRLAQNAVEQVFIYEVSFTDVFNQQLKNSPSRDLSDLEFTVLIRICLGVTNDGIGWLIGTSRQSVERIISGLYRKMKVASRRDAPQGVPTLLESRTRLCYEAMTRGWVNPHLLREEDAALRELVKGSLPRPDRLYINRDWLEADS